MNEQDKLLVFVGFLLLIAGVGLLAMILTA